MSFKNKVAIVTGAGQGIGLEICSQLAKEGVHVFLNDIDITRLPMYKRAQMGIGYLPQEASVFRKLSVEDNISAVLEMTKLSKAEQKEKLESLLDEFRLQRVRKNNGDTLSGGERRRTEIARALAVDPKFILLDEPFAGVDPIAVEDIQAIVAKLKFKNIGILITDHNVNETLSICDRAYLLIDGKIFEHGTAEELAGNEQVRRLYLGRNFELKRKDYLHDEARDQGITLDKLIYAVESALVNLENIEKEQAANQRSFGYRQNAEDENLQLKEFRQFMSELKSSLYTYAEENKKADLLSLLNTLYADIDLDSRSLLNRLDFELRGMQG